jgi:hypothetical protein
MKIKELLSDDDLYELWMLVGDAIWDVLIDNYSSNDIKEAFHKSRALRHTRRPIARTIPKPFRLPPVNPFLPKAGFETSKPDKRSF